MSLQDQINFVRAEAHARRMNIISGDAQKRWEDAKRRFSPSAAANGVEWVRAGRNAWVAADGRKLTDAERKYEWVKAQRPRIRLVQGVGRYVCISRHPAPDYRDVSRMLMRTGYGASPKEAYGDWFMSFYRPTVLRHHV